MLTDVESDSHAVDSVGILKRKISDFVLRLLEPDVKQHDVIMIRRDLIYFIYLGWGFNVRLRKRWLSSS